MGESAPKKPGPPPCRSAFVLHPDALADLIEIWEFIATDNSYAADGDLEEIQEATRRAEPAVISTAADRRLFLPLCSCKVVGLGREKSLRSFWHSHREILHHRRAFNAMKSLCSSRAPRENCSTVAAIPASWPPSCAKENDPDIVRAATRGRRALFLGATWLTLGFVSVTIQSSCHLHTGVCR
jgi:hypothetical protein